MRPVPQQTIGLGLDLKNLVLLTSPTMTIISVWFFVLLCYAVRLFVCVYVKLV